MEYNEFLQRVSEREDLPRDRVEALVSASLETLAERISGGEARDLAAQLPTPLKPPLEQSDEPAEAFDADEFVERVADRAELDEDTAREGTHVVLETLREAVSKGEFDEVLSQLPRDIRALAGVGA
jgi:uncharacterized protein (DUF2267 family)